MPEWEQVVEHAPFSPRDMGDGVVFASRMWISNAYQVNPYIPRGVTTPGGARRYSCRRG